MKLITKIATCTTLGFGALGGSFLGGMYHSRIQYGALEKFIHANDSDGDGVLNFGEAIQAADSNKDGHLSESEKKDVDKTWNLLRSSGEKMSKSAENLGRAVTTLENQ